MIAATAEHKANVETARAFQPREYTMTPMRGIWGEHWFHTDLTRDDFPQIQGTCYTCKDFAPEVVRKVTRDSPPCYSCKHGIVARADRDAIVCKMDVTEIHLRRCREREVEIHPPRKEPSGQWTLF